VLEVVLDVLRFFRDKLRTKVALESFDILQADAKVTETS
jgi:hypothetical protein